MQRNPPFLGTSSKDEPGTLQCEHQVLEYLPESVRCCSKYHLQERFPHDLDLLHRNVSAGSCGTVFLGQDELKYF